MKGNSHIDYAQKVCIIQYNELIQDNESVLSKYIDICSSLKVVPIFDFPNKRLHLNGSPTFIEQAGRLFYNY